jgi:lipopolysaccharide transport system permease protein
MFDTRIVVHQTKPGLHLAAPRNRAPRSKTAIEVFIQGGPVATIDELESGKRANSKSIKELMASTCGENRLACRRCTFMLTRITKTAVLHTQGASIMKSVGIDGGPRSVVAVEEKPPTVQRRRPSPLTTIRPTKGWGVANPGEVWKSRGLLAALAIRDIKLRYRQTALGVAWVVLQPLLASGILAFVFGTVAGVTKPGKSSVFIFVLAGFIGWSLFSTTFGRAGQSLLQQSVLISKVFFPRIILPASAAVAALLDAGVGFALFALLALFSGLDVGWQIVFLPVWLGLLVVFAFGLGLISAALSVRFRDVQHITPVFIQILFYASPVAYQTSAVPEKWRALFLMNPLAPLFEGLRWSLLGEGHLHPTGILYGTVVAVIVCAVGLTIFHRFEKEFADVI